VPSAAEALPLLSMTAPAAAPAPPMASLRSRARRSLGVSSVSVVSGVAAVSVMVAPVAEFTGGLFERRPTTGRSSSSNRNVSTTRADVAPGVTRIVV
jgi:outer membrane scaffolding protein for murein synthesis (MipA/OmpV family)